MPSNSNDKGHKNLTLRLPDEFHRQLQHQAQASGHTLNGHLVNIVRGHLMGSGYYPNVIKSLSGRLFEIGVVPIPHEHAGRLFCSQFVVSEYHPLYSGQRAEYLIGVDSQLAFGGDPFGIVNDVGIGLLNFYNRKGFEIDQLAWHKVPSEPDSPVSQWKDNWRYIGPETIRNVDEFLIALGRNHWKDRLLVATGQSQERRFDSIRKEEIPSDLVGINTGSTMQIRALCIRFRSAMAADVRRRGAGIRITEDQQVIVLPRHVQHHRKPA